MCVWVFAKNNKQITLDNICIIYILYMILSIEHGRVQELKQSMRSIRCRGGKAKRSCLIFLLFSSSFSSSISS